MIRKDFWVLLNSPFVLFLMTSVFISLGSWLFQSYNEYNEKVETLNKNISEVVNEIRYRTSYLSDLEKESFTRTSMYTAHGAIVGIIGNADADGDNVGDFSPIYEKFSRRTIVSLLWELKELTENISNAPNVEEAVNASKRLIYIWNGEIEILNSVVPGVRDSTWRFRNKNIMEEYSALLLNIKERVFTVRLIIRDDIFFEFTGG